MNNKSKTYRILVAGGVFFTALSFTASLVYDNWMILASAAILFSGLAVYGAWRLWLIRDKKARVSCPEDGVCQDPLVRSLASALSSSYLKGVEGLSDGERVFVSSYLTQVILYTVQRNTLFNKSIFCDLLSKGCDVLFLEMKQYRNPLQLVWEMEPVSVSEVIQDSTKLYILNSSTAIIISKLKLSE